MERRRVFDEDAALYDRCRPRYVPELFQDVLAASGLNQAGRVLEIGIGTGQATLPFLQTGCRLTAVELGERLATFCRRRFSGYKNLEVVTGDFLDFESQQPFDLIYSATAFHWIPEAQGLEKAFRLLREGGTLALFWNHPHPFYNDPTVAAAAQEVYRRHLPGRGEPKIYGREDGAARAQSIRRGGFSDVETRWYTGWRVLDASAYIALLNTYSDHRSLPAPVRCALERELIEIIDAAGGRVEIQDTIDLHLAHKGRANP